MPENDHQDSAAPALPAFPVVVIGSSAGGLDAMEPLFRGLPPQPGMAFVVLQHSAPEPGSHLPAILSHFTDMPVMVAEDGACLEANKIYVLPSSKLGSIKADGSFLLEERTRAVGRFLPIDHLLHSAAEVFKERVVAVILSGMDADGSVGFKAVKAAGGLTFAQSEESATYFTMPLAAIRTGAVDFVLPAEEIGARLVEVVQHPLLLNAPPATGMEDHWLEEILRRLREHSGIDFPLYKQSTVRRRIARRMILHKLDTYQEYARYLAGHPEEAGALHEDMLIKVTDFFRDPQVFEALKEQVFPAIVKEKSNDIPIRAWVPGCATGEEVYSLAISLLEYLGNRPSLLPIQIFGTDISDKAIEKARLGLYSRGEVASLTPGRLRRFFVETDGGYRIKKTVRDVCIFARQDFTSDPPFTRMDLISCRNVLIYLGRKLQSRVLPLFHYALAPGGFLLLGPSESVGEYTNLFAEIDKKHKIFSKKRVAEHIAMEFKPSRAQHIEFPQLKRLGQPRPGYPGYPGYQEEPDLLREADRLLLSRYAPAAVVVNEDLDILVFRGRTSPYFTPRAGKASLNLFSLVQDTLRMETSNLVRKAKKSGEPERREEMSVLLHDKMTTVSLEVVPFSPHESAERFYLIIFDDKLFPVREQAAPAAEAIPESEKDRLISSLRTELSSTQEYLQTLMEEKERASQEMQAANEEILSSNEELQSINEELQTAKEELESSNEELSTVNQELQDRNDALFRVNNDLQNLIASVEIPIVIVDEELRIRRISPSAEKILSLIPSDGGRLITDINIKLDLPDLEPLLTQVIDSMTSAEREVRDKDGRWYSLRIRPYKTEEKKIEGAVLSLVDIDQLKRAAQDVEDERNFARSIVETVAEPLLSLDAQLNVVTANPAFHAAFGLDAERVIGRHACKLPLVVWCRNGMREILETRLPAGESVEDEPLAFAIPGKGIRHFTFTARKMQPQVKQETYLLAFRDVTERVQSEEALREAKEQAETASRYKSLFLANMSHEIRTPMNAVIGLTELMLGDELPGEQRERAEAMRESAHSLLAIIDDVLDFSKIEAGRMEFVDEDFSLTKLLNCVLTEQKLLAERKGLTLTARVAEGVPDGLRGPVVRLRQVLTNLLSNAVKFTGSGSVSLEVSNVTGKEPETVRRGVRALTLEFRVTDTGPGMDAETLERIFQSFTQGDSSLTKRFKGTGLGLAISRMIVEHTGGSIGVQSRKDSGSAFSFLMPLDRARGDVSAASEAGGELPLPPLRILVAEDNTINQMVADQILDELGHPHVIAPCGREALQKLATERFDVVLMDIQMPGMDGLEATRRIRAGQDGVRDTKMPVIGLSAYAMKEDVERFLAAGFDGYIIKPFDMETLTGEVRRVLTAKGRLGESVPWAVQEATAALERFGERTELRDKLIAIYRQQAPETMRRLAAAVESVGTGAVDTGAVDTEAHALASIASTIGDERTLRLARRMMQAVREQRPELGGILQELRASLNDFLGALDKLAPQKGQPS